MSISTHCDKWGFDISDKDLKTGWRPRRSFDRIVVVEERTIFFPIVKMLTGGEIHDYYYYYYYGWWWEGEGRRGGGDSCPVVVRNLTAYEPVSCISSPVASVPSVKDKDGSMKPHIPFCQER